MPPLRASPTTRAATPSAALSAMSPNAASIPFTSPSLSPDTSVSPPPSPSPSATMTQTAIPAPAHSERAPCPELDIHPSHPTRSASTVMRNPSSVSASLLPLSASPSLAPLHCRRYPTTLRRRLRSPLQPHDVRDRVLLPLAPRQLRRINVPLKPSQLRQLPAPRLHPRCARAR